MASNFSVIPIRWLLTVDSEMAFFVLHSLAEGVREFQSTFQSKNRYHTHRFMIHAIAVFSVKFTVEFTT